ncbi:MAG: DNA mismatch repair protein MutS, partial [Longicatena sp.]
VNVEVHEEDDEVTFLYRVVDGKADKSYGINVARLAHLPSSLLDRAKQILDNLEVQPNVVGELQSPSIIAKENPLYEQIIQQVRNVDVNKMTPIEAMQLLYEIKEKV